MRFCLSIGLLGILGLFSYLLSFIVKGIILLLNQNLIPLLNLQDSLYIKAGFWGEFGIAFGLISVVVAFFLFKKQEFKTSATEMENAQLVTF